LRFLSIAISFGNMYIITLRAAGTKDHVRYIEIIGHGATTGCSGVGSRVRRDTCNSFLSPECRRRENRVTGACDTPLFL
jgi:hypothetical protein